MILQGVNATTTANKPERQLPGEAQHEIQHVHQRHESFCVLLHFHCGGCQHSG
jgi:hypothetical protein